MIRRRTKCPCPECSRSVWDRLEQGLGHPIIDFCLVGMIAIAVVTIAFGLIGVN